MKALVVYCPQKVLGCEWVGELGALERHLTGRGAPQAAALACDYVVVECMYKCGEHDLRQYIREHEAETCGSRPAEVRLVSVSRQLDKARADYRTLKEDSEAEVAHLKELLRAKSQVVFVITAFLVGLLAMQMCTLL